MSISSSEGPALPGDLSTRYQKLASEYAKVRAQVTVLKKAVVDEQSKSKELKDQILTKDQSLRKHNQEIDSLTFRNQQLTKRVTVLQDELDGIQNHGKKSRIKKETPTTLENSEIFQEELRTKILDNERLVHELQEKRQELEEERTQWKETKSIYERLLSEQEGCRKCYCDKLSVKQDSSASHKTHTRSSRITDNKAAGAANLRLNVPYCLDEIFLHVKSLFSVCVQKYPMNSETGLVNIEPNCTVPLPNLSQVLYSLESFIAFYNPETWKNSESCVGRMLSEIIDVLRQLIACKITVNDSLPRTEVVRCLRSMCNILEGHFKTLCSIENSVGNLERSQILSCLNQLLLSCKLALVVAAAQNNDAINREDINNSMTPCLQCSTFREKLKRLEEKIAKFTISNDIEAVQSLEVSDCMETESKHPKTYSLESKFGRITALNETLWQDPKVKAFVDSKISQVISDRLAAEAKVTRLIGEMDASRCRLEESSNELNYQSSLASQLQEQLTTTTRNYEDQLSSMSEHMANMNDRLTAQETHIEQLTYELQTKDHKRGWTK